ncbi:MAG TPA: hypothetical protein VMP08_14845, partial [Anaerolineae bacterium]|nr:hypothetical protein [Anaerolineae bacterium]
MKIVDVANNSNSRERIEEMIRRWILCMIALWLVGCAGTPQVNVSPAPTIAPTQPAPTLTPLAERVQPRLVSHKSIADFRWEPDGRTLIFSQSEKCPTGCKTTWYRFDVTTGVTTTFTPQIVTIGPQVWKRLTDSDNYPPEISPQQSPSISPSGNWVIYSRIEPGYVGSTCQKGPCPPPMELWLAHVDGSESVKIGALGSGTECFAMGWFDQERKVLLECGYEGPAHFAVADLSMRTVVDFNDIAKRSVMTLHGAELSPDGSRLAVLNILT